MVTTRAALRAASAADGRVGLTLDRYFTTRGVHPYDDLEWEHRDAVITDHQTGEVSFEQRDVEFPKSWSMNATTIVAQKYFRGHLGTPGREHSVRHMIDRVADTITQWGTEGGYFADADSAEVFNHELKHLLVTQKAAFNSPVWFNVGVEDKPQCSACFILSVEDQMTSILNWYYEEGIIFKGGSGSGVNLSRIRSSQEKLKGGGEASGPVSFMRGADASAGTIKCLHADTDVVTDRGVVRIADVQRGDRVLTRHGLRHVEAVHDNGERDVVRVSTELGDDVVCTPEHRFWVRGRDGEGWREARQLRDDDRVLLDLAATDHGTPQPLDPVEPGHHNEVIHRLPATLDEGLALWLGLVAGDGSITDNPHAKQVALQIGDEDADLADSYEQLVSAVFGEDVHVFRNRYEGRADASESVRFSSSQILRFLRVNGLLRAGADSVRVPGAVWSSPEPVRAAFLAGLFEADGHVGNGYPTLSTINEELALDVHRLLLSVGIPSLVYSIDERAGAFGTAPVWCVRVVGCEGVRAFAKAIGFVSGRKSQELEVAVTRKSASNYERSWSLPHVVDELGAVWHRAGPQLRRAIAPYCRYAQPRSLSLLRARRLLEQHGEELTDTSLPRFAEGTDFYVGVTVEPAGRAPVVDLTVDGVHEYEVHGLVTHNSGGKTRRAAKMVILDSDHPDIEEFIWCKRDEEQKVRALEAAGYDMSFDSQAMSTVQYQNANNSVRVDDDFMRAVENDEIYDLIGRTDGEVKKSVRARDLFRQISQAAWECADPGLQYDTTINHWHTTPNAGRINGSNPCSEYMHLDNSACNLASLNLRKFEYDGVFDTEAFTRAVEIMFTAQEIIVGNSSYPTDKIAENAKAYRQLGLGYANLGGLLMSQGIAYDSDEGRAWAGAITALMTGHAYRTSAELAQAQGPFAGFGQDREGTLRVLRQHRDALADIDEGKVPTNILDAARRSWEEAVELGTEHGVRNAQASVLAPTGCLVGGSLVPTERGVVRLSSLGDPAGSRWQDLGVDVATDDGTRQASHFYVNGAESVVTVDTTRGHRIQGTPAHRIKVVEADGSWEWKRFGDLQAGDSVPLAMNTMVGEPQTVSLPPLGEAYRTGERHAMAPQTMTPELAELVGYFMGDGSLHAKGLRLCVADGDFEVIERLTQLGKQLFNLEAQTSQQSGYTEVALQSVRLAQWWEAAGFAEHTPRAGHQGKGWHPHIPDAVLHANDRSVYAAFLRGLFEADGTVTVGYPEWTTSSLAFSHDVQSLLLALGYPTTRGFHTSGRGSQLAVLRLLNTSYHQRWLDEIGFLSDRKTAVVAIKDSTQSARYDRIPVTRELIDRVAPDNDRIRQAMLTEHRRHGRVSRRIATEAYQASGDPELGHLLGFFYDEIHSAELGEDELTYDVSVPANTTYVANGFISHNTIGLMMDCDTTGVEPDLGLVKMKKLVGGGTMRIINQTVPEALEKLGYQPEQVEAIVDYIDKHSTIEGAPGLRDEHLPVFDCAIGERSIAPRGHVRMMGAVQPWISGAISKCVTGETLVPTEDGLVRIGDLHRGERPDTFRDDVRRVASLGEEAKTDGFYYGGVRPVTCVTLRSGHAVTGTENHRLLVVDDQGPSWRFIDDLEPGDHVAVQYGADLWAAVPARFDDFVPSPLYGCQKSVRLPEAMSAELAFLLGAYCSEGSIAGSTWTVAFSNADDGVLQRIADTIRSVFDVEPRINRPSDRCASVTVTSKTIVEFFEHAGCGAGAANKRIPESVLQSPRDMVLAFLQGLFLDAYATTAGNSPKLALCVRSPQLLDDYQAVLTNLGIVHSRVSKYNPDYDQTYGEVYASGSQAGHLAGLVPFLETEKARRAADLPTHSSPHGSCDVVPGISGRELYELIPPGRAGGESGQVKSVTWRFLLDERTDRVSRKSLERVAAIPGVELPGWLQRVLDDGLHFSEVASVEDGGQREVYDLSVPTTHAFVGNGIVNHNTVNMPESATVEDVEEMYFEGWKLGLKAIAIYRDNCKVSQPLAVADSQSKSVGEEAESEPATTTEQAEQQGMVRRRLPKQRPSQTLSFTVGDAEGYLTAGEYPGDGLGEIFVKLGKQGSTLSGVMDAFAIAVSLGLQYGVPLEAYVKKFVNTRFEPSGITDDREVKFASSLIDYIFRRLAIEYLPPQTRQEIGIYTIAERNAQLEGGYGSSGEERQEPVADAEGQTMLPVEKPTHVDDVYGDAPMCVTCGVQMVRAGSCHLCQSCGATSGCS